ncbi:MAG: hypothetical protein OES47_00970 [Acidobacteriota bacterium]|nr:hypothetical protein [Acidobacteriota bacterium]
MLIALLAAFLLGGGGASGAILTPGTVKEIGKQVEAQVSDTARAEAAAETLAKLKVEVKGFEKTFAKSGKGLTKLYKDHGADGDRMQGVLAELNASWEASQQRAIDLRFELKESLTEEEWAAVFEGE